MSYLVLARKWRPLTFDDVAGQEVIVRTLRQALSSQRLAHAFLFSGSRGVGKTTLARILAKALCCEAGISPNPCGTCSICVSISNGSSLDIVEIDGASNTGVDDIRELKETIRYQPSHSRFKVFIIDEVHMLSTNAFNALLKTLEEPPPHVKFVLATTEPHKIPVTILSRCQRYDFRRLKASVIFEQLKRILKSENLSIEDDGLRLIAQVADGGMRDALSLTDQVLSFAPTNAKLSDVSALLGVTSRKTILDMTLFLLNRDFQSVFRVIDEIDSSGGDLRKFADDVANEIRHLTVAKATGTIRGLVDLSEEEMAQIDSISSQFDLTDLQRVFTFMLEGVDQIARSQQPRMSLELVCLRIADRPSAENLISISQAISRLEALSQKQPKREVESSTAKAPAISSPLVKGGQGDLAKSLPEKIPSPALSRGEKSPEPSLSKSEKPSPVVIATAADTKNVSRSSGVEENKWPQFVRAIAKINQSIGVYLEHGKPKRNAEVAFEHRFYRDRILEVHKESWFVEIVEQIYGTNASLNWVFEENTEEPSMSIRETRELEQKTAQAQIEQSARNHPIVKKALALFGGEIKAVKPIVPPKELQAAESGIGND